MSVSALITGCGGENQATTQLRKDLAATQQYLGISRVALTNATATIEAVQSKTAQLTTVLTNSTAQLAAARARIQQLESLIAMNAASAAAASGTAARDTLKYAPRIAPTTSLDTYAAGQIVFFTNLYGKNDQVLARNVECTGVYGRKVAFKESDSSRRMAFDVEDIHPAILAHLSISADTQKSLQTQQDLAWSRLQTAQISQAAIEEQDRKARQAEEARERAAWAEKQFERDMQVWALQNDAARADATMRAADAAIIQALNPAPAVLNVNQNANQNIIRRY